MPLLCRVWVFFQFSGEFQGIPMCSSLISTCWNSLEFAYSADQWSHSMTISFTSLWFNSIDWNGCKKSMEFLCPIASSYSYSCCFPLPTSVKDLMAVHAKLQLILYCHSGSAVIKDRTFKWFFPDLQQSVIIRQGINTQVLLYAFSWFICIILFE